MRWGRSVFLGSAARRASLLRNGIAERATAVDWFDVLVDIGVVIVGIFLAFQVDKWWDDQKASRNQTTYLQRLLEESRTNLAAVERAKALHDGVGQELLTLQAAVDAGAADGLRARPGFGCRMLQLPAARLAALGYQEPREPGALDLVRDPDLRRRLRAASAEHAFVAQQLDYFRANFLRYGDVVDRHVRYRIDTGTGAHVCATDVMGMAADPDALSALAKIYRDHRTFSRFRSEEAAAERQVQARLECLLNGRCGAPSAGGALTPAPARAPAWP